MQKKIKNYRIGIYFSPHKSLGGGYQYAVSVLRGLLSTGSEVYIFNSSADLPNDVRVNKSVQIIDVTGRNQVGLNNLLDNLSYFMAKYFPWVPRVLYKIGFFHFLYLFLRFYRSRAIKLLDSKGLDVIFFPIPVYLSTMIKTPVVVSILDLEHRFKTNFKEATAGGRWEYREFSYRKIAQRASNIFVDSEKSRRDLIKYYGAKSVTVLKYIPPTELTLSLSRKVKNRLKKKFNITRKYVFYPAKFWPHKNQINLVKSIEILKQRGILLDLVLTGSRGADFSTFEQVWNYIKLNGLKGDVKYFGYVSGNELSYLYSNALCMAMPTYFGPTNIPVYEAWRMHTPVIYSDIEGCREQLGDAGLLVNPGRPIEIANAIEKLYKDENLRKKLIIKGAKKLSEWTEKDFDFTIRSVVEMFE